MKITKYGQSAVLCELKGKRILIDPGKYCYGEGKMKPEDFKSIDVILLTHIHRDHCLPEALKIIKENNNCPILTNWEVKELLDEEGIDSEALEVGETRRFGEVTIKTVKAVHGELPDGRPKPETIGFLINNKVYHSGDTVYLKEKPYADVVCVPICGMVVMDLKEAARFIREIRPKLVIPIHYDNPAYPVDPKDFEKEMARSEIKVKILDFGEVVEI